MILHLFGCLLFESAQIEVDIDVNDTGLMNVDTADVTDSDTGSDTDTEGSVPDCVPSTEVCDGIDNDCDGDFDDLDSDIQGATLYYIDGDNDGYGISTTTALLCNPTAGWSTNDLDCNDAEALAFTNATEVCDGVDTSQCQVVQSSSHHTAENLPVHLAGLRPLDELEGSAA